MGILWYDDGEYQMWETSPGRYSVRSAEEGWKAVRSNLSYFRACGLIRRLRAGVAHEQVPYRSRMVVLDHLGGIYERVETEEPEWKKLEREFLDRGEPV